MMVELRPFRLPRGTKPRHDFKYRKIGVSVINVIGNLLPDGEPIRQGCSPSRLGQAALILQHEAGDQHYRRRTREIAYRVRCSRNGEHRFQTFQKNSNLSDTLLNPTWLLKETFCATAQAFRGGPRRGRDADEYIVWRLRK
ncbi:hypothetical protein Q2941_29340 [Bradyrhizobium sp. UFLA05-153]